MLWDLADIVVNVLKAIFWLFVAWCLVTKGFLYCFVLLLITLPVWKIVIPLLHIVEKLIDQKMHPEKYRHIKPNNDDFSFWIE